MLLQMTLLRSFMAEWYSTVYAYHTILIQSSVGGHVLTVVNAGAVSIGAHVSF